MDCPACVWLYAPGTGQNTGDAAAGGGGGEEEVSLHRRRSRPSRARTRRAKRKQESLERESSTATLEFRLSCLRRSKLEPSGATIVLLLSCYSTRLNPIDGG